MSIDSIKKSISDWQKGKPANGMYEELQKIISIHESEPHISARALEWVIFSDSVFNHVEEYTVPQYGDKGEDNVTDWSAEECFKQIDKYLKRRNSNQRPGQRRLDILKMAHYLCLAEAKLEDDNRHGLV